MQICWQTSQLACALMVTGPGAASAGAVALVIAARYGWAAAYGACALFALPAMTVGLVMGEPDRRRPSAPPASLAQAVVSFFSPLVEFLQRRGAFVVLLFVLIHKIGDTLANLTLRLLFEDLGFTNDEVRIDLGHPRFRHALEKAATWLAGRERRNGSLVGGTSTSTPNTNSTGLAAWALASAGRCVKAQQAARWVERFQVGPQPTGSKLAGQRGAIAYDRAALKAGRHDGITTQSQDQWRRATAQAAPALRFRHGC